MVGKLERSWSGKVRIAIASIVDNLSLCGLHCTLGEVGAARSAIDHAVKIDSSRSNNEIEISFSLCP